MADFGVGNHRKRLKEEFVTGLTGSSMLEIAALSLIVPGVVVLRHWISFCNGIYACKKKKKDGGEKTDSSVGWRIFLVSLVVDSIFVMLPIISFLTVLSDWVYVCAILLVIIFLYILARRSAPYASGFSESSDISPYRTNIISYRVSMMTVTCLCILAVDFNVFPRRYAKVETYGTGLMDLGVGSFVLANALVSKQARCSMMGEWKKTLQSITPLVILGFGRLLFTKSVDYQVHVGEYGVHWNFFFTLAAVSLLTSITRLHPRYCGLLGLSILLVYQILLLSGLNEYLLSNERTSDIISLNKEGIFSVFGYWGMYLVGVYLGNILFFSIDVATQARTKIWFLCIIFWFLTIFIDKYIERVSRRMCNLGYVALVLAQNFQVMSVMLLSDVVPGQKPLLLEEAIDQNLLAIFLLANVLTGLVNLFIDTLSTSTAVGFGILAAYSSALVGFVGLARFCRVRLKFW